MATIDELVQDFLAQKCIAVTGVSLKREDAANANYRKFKQAGYTVYAINPNAPHFEGEPCYPDLKSLPQKPDAVFIVNRPAITEKIVQECIELDIKRVWMHCSLGAKPLSFLRNAAQQIGSASDKAVQLCRENGIAVIPGACPLMFLKPDPGHLLMRKIWRGLGALAI